VCSISLLPRQFSPTSQYYSVAPLLRYFVKPISPFGSFFLFFNTFFLPQLLARAAVLTHRHAEAPAGPLRLQEPSLLPLGGDFIKARA
jgi:hypothetical protein